MPSFIKIGPVIMKGVHKSSKYYSVLQYVIEISPLVFDKKKIKMWKVDRQTDQLTGDIQQVIRKDQQANELCRYCCCFLYKSRCKIQRVQSIYNH